MPFIETDRLLLSKLTLEDAPFIIELLNTPGWLQYIGDKGVKTTEEAEFYIQNGPMKNYEEYGFGLLKTTIKTTEEIIGLCGLIKRENLDHVDIGFAFLPQFTKKGYAYEAAQATMDYAQQELKLNKVLGITLPENTKSIRLLEKVGLTLEGELKLSPEDETLLVYAVNWP